MYKTGFTESIKIAKRKSLRKYSILKGLYNAIDNNELFLHYYPRISGKNIGVTGLEVKVLWKHPEVGTLNPSEFLPLAEETGLMKHIDKWVLRNACNQIRLWQYLGYYDIKIEVSLSDWQFTQGTLPKLIKEILRETGLDPGYLIISIKEEILLKKKNFTIRTLNELANMGVKISIDNFTFDNLSISYLKLLPVHYLKIGKTLINDMTDSKSTTIIIESLINIGHALNLKIIAEEVETGEHFIKLQNMGCDELQGGCISEPFTAEEIMERLDSVSAG